MQTMLLWFKAPAHNGAGAFFCSKSNNCDDGLVIWKSDKAFALLATVMASWLLCLHSLRSLSFQRRRGTRCHLVLRLPQEAL